MKRTVSNTHTLLLVVIFLFVLNILLMVLHYKIRNTTIELLPSRSDIISNSHQKITPTVNVPTRPPAVYGHGRTEWLTSSSDTSIPIFTTGYIDPLGAKKDETQVCGVMIHDSKPIHTVTVRRITDHMTKSYTMTLVKGTQLDGQWETSWTFDDTINNNFQIEIKAVSDNGFNINTITFR